MANLRSRVALSDETASAVTHTEYPNLKLASGMVHEVAAKAMDGEFDNMIAYVAGPPVMVDTAIRTLIVGGMPTKEIRYDKFG